MALLYAAVMFVTRFKYLPQCWIDGQIYFLDSDCFSRMTRVRRLLEDPAANLFQPFHPFENFPDGIATHTTSLLDWGAAVICLIVSPFSDHALDWAGLLLSPALAAVAGYFVYQLSSKIDWGWFRIPLLLLFLLQPFLIWATAAGRPDHQALVVSLLMPAFLLEILRWKEPKYALPAGILWGLALWVSPWEPLLLLAFVSVFNLVARRAEQWKFLVPAVAIPLLTLIGEGIPPLTIEGVTHTEALQWLGTIGEARGASPVWLVQFGFGLLIVPFWVALSRQGRKAMDKHWLLFALTTLLLIGLFLVRLRWGYFLALTYPIFLLLTFRGMKSVVLKVAILLLHLTPVVLWNVRELTEMRPNMALVELRQKIAPSIDEEGAVLGPWWLSPALLYFTGQPIVAGSSHQSLPGIMDTAVFFTTDDFRVAAKKLKRRRVRWIVVSDPESVYANSHHILHGSVPDTDALSKPGGTRLVLMRLWKLMALPPSYRPVAVSDHFRLFKYSQEVK